MVGVVLIVKFVIGVLVWDDIWFGGWIKNLWNIYEGSIGLFVGLVVCIFVGIFYFNKCYIIEDEI